MPPDPANDRLLHSLPHLRAVDLTGGLLSEFIASQNARTVGDPSVYTVGGVMGGGAWLKRDAFDMIFRRNALRSLLE